MYLWTTYRSTYIIVGLEDCRDLFQRQKKTEYEQSAQQHINTLSVHTIEYYPLEKVPKTESGIECGTS